MTVPIPNFNQARILIIGDVMLDRYWRGETSRISPEAPVPVVHVKQRDERPGGAGNVALNAAALGCQVTLLGIVGQDAEATQLKEGLNSAGVDCHFEHASVSRTITKLRVLSQHQQLIRLDFESEFQLLPVEQLAKTFKQQLKKTDVVILSDYGKGTLQQSKLLIQLARQAKKPVLVDPKNIDFSAYQGASLITPNFKEFKAVVGDCRQEKDIVEKAQQLLQTYQFENLLITRGESGMTLIRPNKIESHFPAQAQEVFDVTGAGDTVIAVLAGAIATGLSLPDAVKLANMAAGIVVTKLGAATVSAPELAQAAQGAQSGGILNEEQLLLAIQRAHKHGKKVVMTNGCFDILHAGHVHYLKQAKALGDYLIVAVNDDASVTRLKGKGRPVNQLTERMTVLAGLNAVDWVVPFSEDTPERLIRKILPDLLVKGGDYKDLNDVVGAEIVLKQGGEVKILDFVAGYSTSAVIEKIFQED